jgi:MoaA/NifB/PqqE/SkfB family radical SAM enzyme
VLLPKRTGDRLRDYVIEHYYSPGQVSRDGFFEFRWRRAVHLRPHLHRIVVHLTDHCNLNCKGCSHFSNLARPAFADPAQLDREFERLAGLFEVTEIYLLGGEPLLHPEVERFLRSARRHFPRTKLILLTNGILLPKMGPEFWRAMGEERITLMYDDYPIALKQELIAERASENGVAVELMEHHDEFFKLPIDVTGSQDAADSFARCRTVANCPTLKDGRLYPCAYIAYIDLFSERFGVEGLEPGAADSISIFETDDAYRIMDFLLNPVPWCSHCDFSCSEQYAWGHSSRSIEEWTCVTTEDAHPEHVPATVGRTASQA